MTRLASPLASPTTARNNKIGDALAGEKRSALILLLVFNMISYKSSRLKKVKVISSPGDEGFGVRARLNLLEERLRGEAGQERF